MKLKKSNIKVFIVLIFVLSIFASQYISYKYSRTLDLKKYKSLSLEEIAPKDIRQETTKAQLLFEALPLKCVLGDKATFAVGIHKEQPMYALKFQHPSEPETKYTQLRRNAIKGRGYELVAHDLKTHLNVTVDYELSQNNKFFITLSSVKYITDKKSYSMETVVCGG